MELQEIVDDIIVEVPYPDESTLERAVKHTLVDFLRTTKFWADDSVIALEVGKFRYDITLPAGAYAYTLAERPVLEASGTYHLEPQKGITSPRAGSRPSVFVMDGNSLLFDGDNNGAGEVSIRTVLLPTYSFTSIPDEVCQPYFEGIRAGAIYRLLTMPNKEWTNRKAASDYLNVYASATTEAKREARGDIHRPARKVRYGGI